MTTKLSPADLAKNAVLINTEHKAVVEANQTSLQHAIAAGQMLRACKDSMPHGEWIDWLAKNCPDISERTAQLYMKLAKNEDKLEAAADENRNTVADLSLRGAAKLLAEPQTEEQKAVRAAKKKSAKSANDLADQLSALAPDEVFKALTRTYLKIADCCRSDINVE
jgi:hypothetical protein